MGRINNLFNPKNRSGQAWLGIAFLLLTYVLGSKGLDTGSWWYYGTTFLSLALAIKFLHKALRPKK